MSKEAKSFFSIESAEVFLASKGLTPAMFEMESIFLYFGLYGFNGYHWWVYDVLKQEGYGFCNCREFPECEYTKCDYDGRYGPPFVINYIFPKKSPFFWTNASTILAKLNDEYEFIVSVKETLITNNDYRGTVATLKATGLRRKV